MEGRHAVQRLEAGIRALDKLRGKGEVIASHQTEGKRATCSSTGIMKSTSGTSSAVQSVLPADEKPRLSQNEKVKDTRPEPAQNLSTRNVTRGVWELARLHTREAWLCWYPAGEQRLGLKQNLEA